MKFKNKDGIIFIPTTKFMEEQMRKSKFLTEVKENKDKENKK